MKKINQLIGNNFIAERLDRIDQLTHVIEDFMSMPLENRTWPVLHRHYLVLMTDDPHFATQARFMQKTLCNHINEQLNLKIKRLDIKLMSLPLASYFKKTGRIKISPETADVLSSTAESIEDEALRETLKRLANASVKTSFEAEK